MSLGIDLSDLSPEMAGFVLKIGARDTSYQETSDAVLDAINFEVGAKQVERLTHRIGTERTEERDAATAAYMLLPLTERKGKPEGAADFPDDRAAVVLVDGGRMQLRGDQWGATVAESPSARSATATPANGEASEKAKEADEDPSVSDAYHRGKHWREDKIGLLMTMASEEKASDPCPEVPPVFLNQSRVKKLTREMKGRKAALVAEPDGPSDDASPPPLTDASASSGDNAMSALSIPEAAPPPTEAERMLGEAARNAKWEPPEMKSKEMMATRRPWKEFGPMMAASAWAMSFYAATRKAFVADGAAVNWTLWANLFSSFTPILDIVHAITYIYAAAMAGRSSADGWPWYDRWFKLVWNGKVKQVIVEMEARQKELGLPEKGDGETHPRKVLDAALGYLRNNQDRMNYPEYRRLGLPITSSYVESAVKQINRRVKGTEKFWTEEGAEANLQLRSDFLSTTNPMPEFWKARQRRATGLRSYVQSA